MKMMKIAALAAVLVVAAVAPGAAQRPTYKRDVPPRLLRQTKVSEDSALKIAKARIPTGTVQALKLVGGQGNPTWSFDFSVPNQPGTYKVNVDAKTGALVGRVEHETAVPRPDTGRTAGKAKP